MITGFEPIFDDKCVVLILGSCPSEMSLAAGQYYGNPRNRFWRVIFGILGEEFTDDYERKKQILLRHHIALWDTIGSCDREGSLDSAIRNAVPNDIASLVRGSDIKCVALNGGKAKAMFRAEVNADVVCLPSTSPANAGMSFDALFAVWQKALSPYLKK